MTTSSTSSASTSWRAARAPTAPAPTSRTDVIVAPPGGRRASRAALLELGPGQLPPAAVLGWRAAGAPQAQDPSDEPGDPEGDERSAQQCHQGLLRRDGAFTSGDRKSTRLNSSH